MSQFVITNAGLAAAIAATNNGAEIHITQFKLGATANYTPVATDTALRGNTVYTGAPFQYSIIDATTINIRCQLGANVGPFTFGEIGLYLNNGTLFALASYPTLQQKLSVTTDGIPHIVNLNCLLKLAQGTGIFNVDSTFSANVREVATFSAVSSPANTNNSPNALLVMEESAGNKTTLLMKRTANTWTPINFVTVTTGTTTASTANSSTIADWSKYAPGTPIKRLLVQDTNGRMRLVQGISGTGVVTYTESANPPFTGVLTLYESSNEMRNALIDADQGLSTRITTVDADWKKNNQDRIDQITNVDNAWKAENHNRFTQINNVDSAWRAENQHRINKDNDLQVQVHQRAHVNGHFNFEHSIGILRGAPDHGFNGLVLYPNNVAEGHRHSVWRARPTGAAELAPAAQVHAPHRIIGHGDSVHALEIHNNTTGSGKGLEIRFPNTGAKTNADGSASGASAFIECMDTAAIRFAVYSEGTVAGRIFSNTSDFRLKKDIVSLDDRELDLLNVNLVNFRWNEQDEATSLTPGVIAQWAQKQFPELVVTARTIKKNEDGTETVHDSLSFNYLGLVPHLVRLQQKYVPRIHALEAEVQELRALVQQLRKHVGI